MRKVTVMIEGLSPYSQSYMHDTPKLPKETMDAYEQRTWREKANFDSKTGQIYIPAMAFKQALDAAAKKLGDQIPGKGKSTYTKFFLADVICDDNVFIDAYKDKVRGITINANSDGVRGSGKRVKRTFPIIDVWSGVASFTILDDTVTPEVFERTMKTAGMGIGIGRFRPEKGGLNGRFKPTSFDWQQI